MCWFCGMDKSKVRVGPSRPPFRAPFLRQQSRGGRRAEAQQGRAQTGGVRRGGRRRCADGAAATPNRRAWPADRRRADGAAGKGRDGRRTAATTGGADRKNEGRQR